METRELSFCSGYDALLLKTSPAAVFLLDKRGDWKFSPDWSRDAWLRESGPHEYGLCFRLWRDALTGFVIPILVTSPTLLRVHPKGDIRCFDTLAEAMEARASFGEPPICDHPWP